MVAIAGVADANHQSSTCTDKEKEIATIASANDPDHHSNNDTEEDAFLEAMARSKGKDWQPLSADNWEEELAQMPIFMDKLPKNHAENEALQAIQALVYDGTPQEIALNFKNQGNGCYRSGNKDQMQYAIQYYTKALEQQCDDITLNVTCLLNRAAVHLVLENNRSAAIDSSRALKVLLNDNALSQDLRLKAFLRLIQALIRTEKLDLAEKKLGEAYACFPDEEHLRKLENELDEKREISRYQEECRRHMMLQKDRYASLLAILFQYRGVQFAQSISFNKELAIHSDLVAKDALQSPGTLFSLTSETMSSLEPCVSIQEDDYITPDSLIWPLNDPSSYFMTLPVLFIYPQTGHYDVIERWDERIRVIDMLKDIFQTKMVWDTEHDYTADTVSLYLPVFVGNSSIKWTRVRLLGPLWESLRITPLASDGILRFWVLPDRGSEDSIGKIFSKKWLKQ